MAAVHGSGKCEKERSPVGELVCWSKMSTSIEKLHVDV